MVKKITALLIVLFSLSQAFAYKAVGSSLGTSFVGHSVMQTRSQGIDISVNSDAPVFLSLGFETASELVSTDLFSSLFGYVRGSFALGYRFERDDMALDVKSGLSLSCFSSDEGFFRASADLVIKPSALLVRGRTYSFHAGLPLTLSLSGRGVQFGASCSLSFVMKDGLGGR